jgi:hypothetical protein
VKPTHDCLDLALLDEFGELSWFQHLASGRGRNILPMCCTAFGAGALAERLERDFASARDRGSARAL